MEDLEWALAVRTLDLSCVHASRTPPPHKVWTNCVHYCDLSGTCLPIVLSPSPCQKRRSYLDLTLPGTLYVSIWIIWKVKFWIVLLIEKAYSRSFFYKSLISFHRKREESKSFWFFGVRIQIDAIFSFQ